MDNLIIKFEIFREGKFLYRILLGLESLKIPKIERRFLLITFPLNNIPQDYIPK